MRGDDRGEGRSSQQGLVQSVAVPVVPDPSPTPVQFSLAPASSQQPATSSSSSSSVMALMHPGSPRPVRMRRDGSGWVWV